MSFDKFLQRTRESIYDQKRNGIYMLDDFYLGRSKNVKARVDQHLLTPHSLLVKTRIAELYERGDDVVSIKYVSEIEEAEKWFVQKFSINYNLENVQWMYKPKDLLEYRLDYERKTTEIKLAIETLYSRNKKTEFFEERQEMYIQYYLRTENSIKNFIDFKKPIEEIKAEVERLEMKQGIPFGLPRDFWTINPPVDNKPKIESEFVVDRRNSDEFGFPR